MRHLLMGIGILVLCASFASAGPVDFTAVDSGWYAQTGIMDSKFQPGNLSYFAGEFTSQGGSGYEYRDYFVFDLSGFGNNAIGASLILPNRGANVGAPFNFNLYNVTTSAATLAVANPGAGIPIFTDLGDGPTYGGVVVPSNSTDPIVVTLNAAALAAINGSGGGMFIIGGDVDGGGVAGDHYLFVDHPLDLKPTLSIQTSEAAVPEPGTASMAILGGIAVLAGAIRRSRA